MELLITEITDMSAGTMCIAAWDAAGERTLRPLPDGHHWQSDSVRQLGLLPGSVIDVTAANKPHGGDYPHRTEDFEISGAHVAPLKHGGVDWFGEEAPDVATSIATGFGNSVSHTKVWKGRRQGVYVPRGTVCPSLIGINMHSGGIEFFEAFGKLKARIQDGLVTYELPVSSHQLHVDFNGGGLAAVTNALPKNQPVHLRLGLARAWAEHPEQCYVMLNGVNW